VQVVVQRQRWCRAGAVVVQSRCWRGFLAELQVKVQRFNTVDSAEVQQRCRGSAELLQSRFIRGDCAGAGGAEVQSEVQRCRGSAVRGAEVQMRRGAPDIEVLRCWGTKVQIWMY
jgi:hypothetical protein